MIVSVSVPLPVFSGAVYRPSEVIVPRDALQVTEGFNALAAFVTVAVICSVCPLFSAVAAGLTLTATDGSSVIGVDGDAVVSAMLVAVTAVELHPRLAARDTRRR